MTAKDERSGERAGTSVPTEAGSGDSPKRQGDKLGRAAGGAGAAPQSEVSGPQGSGDSPKRQGDKLDHAAREAAGGGGGGRKKG